MNECIKHGSCIPDGKAHCWLCNFESRIETLEGHVEHLCNKVFSTYASNADESELEKLIRIIPELNLNEIGVRKYARQVREMVKDRILKWRKQDTQKELLDLIDEL